MVVPAVVPLSFRAVLPLVVAMDLARCSSKIDDLLDALNQSGMKYGPNSYLRLA